MPKKNNEDLFYHAKRRLFERYGVELTPKLYEELNEKIRKNKAKCLAKESNTRTHFLLDGMIAVYNKSLNAICTFLPIENLRLYDGQDSRSN